MEGIVRRPGEGEPLFGGRIVLKSALPELCLTESWHSSARLGAAPHYHVNHADSFYVLEGEMAFLIHDEEHVLGPGDCVCAPPGVVHGFRSLSPAHWLNMHTPNSGFCAHLQSLDGGGAGGFDNVDCEAGDSIGPVDEAILLRAGEGERLETEHRVATIKIGRDELCLIEFELKPTFGGPDVHEHNDHIDSFFVLDGEVGFTMNGGSFAAGPGTFVAATLGSQHAFTNAGGPGRLLNIHAPSTGFHDRIRQMS
jgi:mannose-6-phosphate isomerase-like protein (cupin superfamily)